MTQDYIKRGAPKNNSRGKAKAAGRGRGAKASNKSTTRATANQQSVSGQSKPPYIAMTLMALTIGVFGYFLWSINGAANHQQPTSTVNQPPTSQPVSSPIAKADPQQIPPPPKEEDWQYIDELKHMTVEVETDEVVKRGPYLMQCATFKDPRRAEAFKAELALLGFESRIKSTTNAKGITHHRVQLGPFEKNRDAQSARHKLSRHKINGCKIWLWS